jgi:hypothetical protein
MFAPDGWIPLSEVYQYFSDYFSENPSLGSIQFTGDEPFELTWDFAQLFDHAYICTVNGEILNGPPRLVQTSNECDHINFHVNLYYGTVGSGEIQEQTEFPHEITSPREYAERLYGPFYGCPIVYPLEEFLKHLEILSSTEEVGDNLAESEEATTDLDMSPKAVSTRILQVWKDNRSLTLKEIKTLIAPNQSFRKFRFAWTLATMNEPSLSRPGRKSTRSGA